MKYTFLFLIGLFWNFATHAQTVELELFASGFSSPVDIANMGDERLFVVERSGVVKNVTSEGIVLTEPFLDIDSIVRNANNQSEQGLLGLAFHPDYIDNGFLFLNYIDNSGNTNIVRYTVDPNDTNKVDIESRELILEIEQPFANHNGGCLKFGPDGYLYIGMGDGGSGNDPINAGQLTNTLLGKMLRIDVDNGLPYSIPSDNPFVEDEAVLDEIWATGLRNPWRYSFDRETGDLWIGDVGQSALEEIDFQAADSEGGENYGWRCYEGEEFTNLSSMEDCQGEFVEPVFQVAHQGFTGPCSITGGYVYRGAIYSEWIGKYICADYCSGDFYIVESDNDGGWNGQQVAKLPHNVSTFGEDSDGELYIASFSNGGIYRLVGETVSTENVIESLKDVQVYPNPTTGITQVSLRSDRLITIEMQLIDMAGKVVTRKTISINGTHNEEFDMSNFHSGTYILQISNEEGLLSKQLVVY